MLGAKKVQIFWESKTFWKTPNLFDVTKGQLNSEWIYEVIVSPKMPTKTFKDFCPTAYPLINFQGRNP